MKAIQTGNNTRRIHSRAATCSAKAYPAFPHHRSKPLRRATCAAVKTADAYVTDLVEAEAKGDWLRAFELLTEANVLKLALPDDAMEGGIRTLAAGGQWQRAADMLDKMVAGGTMPSQPTVTAVFDALAAGKQAERAESLLQVLIAGGLTQPALSVAHNRVVRVVSRSGPEGAVRSYGMLDKMVCSQGECVVEMETFSAVCNELLKAGESEKAEEVLEWRDFLIGD